MAKRDVESGSSSGSDSEGVDEHGMARLMTALGEDGLDDFDRAQLSNLANEAPEDDSSDEDEEDEEGEKPAGHDNEEVTGEPSAGDSEDEEEDEDLDEGTDAEPDAEEEVDMDDVSDVDNDAIPRRRLVINNEEAMRVVCKNIALHPSISWTETLTVTYPQTIDVDVDDDLQRELAFYKQALHGAETARSLAKEHSLPFTRPPDYFAEMVKSDAHMERIRQRLLDENKTIERSEAKKREREGKKFGKQVQMDKLKERAERKRDMQDKLKSLKRKRKGALDGEDGDDGFDVALDDALDDRPTKKGPHSAKKGGISRQARDAKFSVGRGGGKRSKQNTRQSTDDFGSGSGRGSRGSSRGGRGGFQGGSRGGGSSRKPAGGAKRLGKDRRMAARSK